MTATYRKPRYWLKGRLWIEGPEGTFLGYGRIILLERIRDYGSITAAARSMDMSYRHAWDLVDSMNRQGRAAVVETTTGGRGGGGTRLTKAGHQAIETFWQVYDKFQSFLDDQTGRLKF